MKKKVAKYMRFSTDKQELKVQKEEIEKYLEYYKTQNEVESEKEYVDEGLSGKDLNRKHFIEMQEDIKERKINTVIALKLDRLSRSMQDLLDIFEFFEKNKVDVILVKDKLDTSTSQGRLLFYIMGAFAEFERDTIRERLQAGRDYAKIKGTKSGKPMHRPRKNLNVREIVDLYKKGMSMNKLGKLYKVHSLTIKSRLIEEGEIK